MPSLAWTMPQARHVMKHASKLVPNLNVTRMRVQNLAANWLYLLCLGYNSWSCQSVLAERIVAEAL